MKRPSWTPIRALVAVIALVGAAMMLYLVYLHFAPDKQSFCDLGEEISCGVVNKSVYSEIFGIPVSALGVLYFLGVLAVALFAYTAANLQMLFYITIIFLGPSLYLTWTEIYKIQSICILCEGSKALMAILIGITYSQLPKKAVNAPTIILAVLLALFAGLFTYQAHRSAIPTTMYNGLAQCLTEKGYVMYGSIECLQCARQRLLFGDAFQYINEVECKAGYENSDPDRCVSKNIDGTPTWFIEDEKGNTLKAYEKGVVPLEQLSADSGCLLLNNQ